MVDCVYCYKMSSTHSDSTMDGNKGVFLSIFYLFFLLLLLVEYVVLWFKKYQ